MTSLTTTISHLPLLPTCRTRSVRLFSLLAPPAYPVGSFLSVAQLQMTSIVSKPVLSPPSLLLLLWGGGRCPSPSSLKRSSPWCPYPVSSVCLLTSLIMSSMRARTLSPLTTVLCPPPRTAPTDSERSLNSRQKKELKVI